MDTLNQIPLVQGVKLRFKDCHPVKEGAEVWRIIVSFISNIPEADKLIKDYYVWVTGGYLKDHAKLQTDQDSAINFSLEFAKKRFEASGKQVPIENGVACSNEGGVTEVDPRNYIHPLEQS